MIKLLLGACALVKETSSTLLQRSLGLIVMPGFSRAQAHFHDRQTD